MAQLGEAEFEVGSQRIYSWCDQIFSQTLLLKARGSIFQSRNWVRTIAENGESALFRQNIDKWNLLHSVVVYQAKLSQISIP